MARIVQKYGGTSVGSIEKIQEIAQKIIATRAEGHQVVVVLSAMQGETDRLIALARSVQAQPNHRAYDMLVSTGEQVAIALMSMALLDLGCPAHAYLGSQVPIITNDHHKRSHITHINTERLVTDMAEGRLPIVAGFQGINSQGAITTLGRGGSDITAVALAAVLKADECHIYTDVNGVYTSDPRIVPAARLLSRITFEEMLELSSLGAKVLQTRAVIFASKYNVALRVLSSSEPGPGTLITYEGTYMENKVISGVTFDRNQSRISILGIRNQSGAARRIFRAIGAAQIIVDMIVQNAPAINKTIDISFTVQRDDYQEALSIIEKLSEKIGAEKIIGEEKVAKLSIVGIGMRTHIGVATQMFETLGEEGIHILLVTTSEVKVSVLIDEKYLELGARALHAAFKLEHPNDAADSSI